jgi:peptide chain release factor 1
MLGRAEAWKSGGMEGWKDGRTEGGSFRSYALPLLLSSTLRFSIPRRYHPPGMLDRLEGIEKRFETIEAQLQDPAVVVNHTNLQRLGKERAELMPLVDAARRYRKALQEAQEAQDLLTDPEFKDMAAEELAGARARAAELEEKLKVMLLPKDPNDEKAVIVEIRPAAGGEEASLFASELFRMYTRYAERKKWPFELIDILDSPLKGIDRVTFSIGGKGAYSQLKHESGVHRVQRVPVTESGGRIHTSTVTVAVLPEVEDVDVQVRDDDLEVSTFKASAAGGQHVQKNESAIRIIHKPTGVVVTCQDERSQVQNKAKAMQVLRAKLYQLEQERLDKERGALRRGQIGTGDRSEKIRTYNIPQSRITDHRIGESVHNITAFLDGDMQTLLDALNREEQKRLLENNGSM